MRGKATTDAAADAVRKHARAAEALSFQTELGRRTQQEVFAIARKAISDLADAGLEASMATVCCRRLRAMNGSAKTALVAALAGGSEPATVRSAFDLPADQRKDIERAVKELFSADAALGFETRSDLVSGIELTAGDTGTGARAPSGFFMIQPPTN